MDWGDGEYERTAALLLSASSAVLDVAGLTSGRACRVIDVGCGTGNAALAAATRGASALGVDPSPRLVEVARARAARDALDARFVVGDAGTLPADDASFDVAVSVFAVIFAPDAARAARELLRVVRPGGVVALSAWGDTGGIAEAGALLRATLVTLLPPPPPDAPPPPRWSEPGFARGLFEALGATVEIAPRSLRFVAPSAEAWFDEQGEHHPAWRLARRGLAAAGRDADWRALRDASVERLRALSDDPRELSLASPYHVIKVTRPG